ncbi:MAG: UDP-4-amino-4,6-dideoxy-N-acetyl-beta-L-altrosamine N-acetyltransferase [Lachnospiraceae bacterium]|nr:UDP-4-amino-4,6-dideoxy-N-acetyl-beta-L-altrosamine N-acetyltransferase [Lachnospiraceae bacterium]
MKISLRRLQKKDLSLVMKWRQSAEVTKYMYTDPVLTMDTQIQWFDALDKKKTEKYWVIYVEDKSIGVFSLQNIDYKNGKCEAGHYIGELTYRGKGISFIVERNIYDYVFEKLNLNKLCWDVLSFNEAAIHLHEKCGAKIEGVRKQHIRKNNQYYDVIEMAMLRDDWDEVRKLTSYPVIEISD